MGVLPLCSQCILQPQLTGQYQVVTTTVCIIIREQRIVPMILWHSRLVLLNIPTAYLQRGKTKQTNVLDMTLNNLMVRLQ